MTRLQDDNTIQRLTVLESELSHLREMTDVRDTRQDRDLKALEKRLTDRIGAVNALIMNGIKWILGLFAVSMLTIVLKALNLY